MAKMTLREFVDLALSLEGTSMDTKLVIINTEGDTIPISDAYLSHDTDIYGGY